MTISSVSSAASREQAPTKNQALAVLSSTRSMRSRFVSLLAELISLESPTDSVSGQVAVQDVLRRELEVLGFATELVPGDGFADHLVARRRSARPTSQVQLIVGHSDTVWPRGTLAEMPVREEGGCLWGPGAFDMKGGLAQLLVALHVLQDLGLSPTAEPVIFINSDEEVGSPTSKKHIAKLANGAGRSIIVEPSYGPHGLLKTARKGVSRFELRARGRSAHSGLEPEKGASAILALAHAVVKLHSMNDATEGTSVNVGVIRGGTRPNVIAAEATAQVDVRTTSKSAATRISDLIHALPTKVPGVVFSVDDRESAPPLERTERNLHLWDTVRALGQNLGLDLDHTAAGGASDGNTTSIHSPTIDGMGAVGDGAHAVHEHVCIDPSLDRAALMALLLLAPVEGSVAS